MYSKERSGRLYLEGTTIHIFFRTTPTSCGALWCVADVWCVVVYCCMLWCVAVRWCVIVVLWFVAVRCGALWCIVVCCGVLLYVVVRCAALVCCCASVVCCGALRCVVVLWCVVVRPNSTQQQLSAV